MVELAALIIVIIFGGTLMVMVIEGIAYMVGCVADLVSEIWRRMNGEES